MWLSKSPSPARCSLARCTGSRRSRWAGGLFEMNAMLSPVNKTRIGMTDLAWSIVDDEATKTECSSASEYLEWIVLCQRFSAPEAAALLRLRRKRGGRGGVHVLRDDVQLPPEG